MNSVLLLYHK